MLYSTVKDHIQRMNDRQKVNITNSWVTNMTPRKLNNFGETFLTESGLYKLVFQSRAPKAEESMNG
jgi:prophage antirepressor-like protein